MMLLQTESVIALVLYLFISNVNGVLGDLSERTVVADSGLVFLKSKDVLITGDSWTIILTLNVSQHLEYAEYLKYRLTSLSEYFNDNDPEIKRLIRVIDELVEIYQAMVDMLGKKRRIKRFLDGNAKYGTKFIFNFDSNIDGEDLKLTRQIVNKLEKEQDIRKVLLEDHISFTKILDKKVEENSKRILDLTNKVEEEMKMKFTIINRSLSNLEDKFDYLKNLSSTFRLMQAEGLLSLIAANRLQNALEMAGEGRLSFYLLTPKELQKELISISLALPIDLKMIRGLSVEDMYSYRENAKVTVMANSRTLFMAIRLPLVSSDRGYELYTVNVAPVFYTDVNIAMKVEPESNYFMVSNDRQYYSLPDARYVSECNGKQPMICPASVTLLKREVATCVAASFFSYTKKVAAKYCNKKAIINGEDYFWLADMENLGWIFSLMKPLSITIHCGEKNVQTLKLKGFGHIGNTGHCNIYGENFKLLRTHTGVISMKDGESTIVLKSLYSQDIPSLFTTDEMKLVCNKSKMMSAIKGVIQNKRLRSDTGRMFEVPLDTLLSYDDRGEGKLLNRVSIVDHHHDHIKVDTISGMILVIVCLVTSTVTSLIAVTLYMCLCAGRWRTQNIQILNEPNRSTATWPNSALYSATHQPNGSGSKTNTSNNYFIEE